MSRRRRLALWGLALGIGACAAVLVIRPRLEAAIARRLLLEAARRGLLARVASVHIAWMPLVVLEGLHLEGRGFSADTSRVSIGVRPFGGGGLGQARVHVAALDVRGPAGLAVRVVPSVWEVPVTAPSRGFAELREPSTGLRVTWADTDDRQSVDVAARGWVAGQMLAVTRDGEPVAEFGILDGSLGLDRQPPLTRFHLALEGRAVRGISLADAALGPASDVAVRLQGSWNPVAGLVDVPAWSLTLPGATARGALVLDDLSTDPCLDLSLDVDTLDFARVLQTSGMGAPQALAIALGADASWRELGSASLSVATSGRLSDPRSFTVAQKVGFAPPTRMPTAIEALRVDFRHEVVLPDGTRTTIDVSPASPDFIALAAVPPLFLKTLLLAEDSGFYAHHGIDFSEMPAAVLTNWARGKPARGASTITQQLAKNLFLSREKRLGRKLQELCLALLLEKALGKERILEIYLNVIEWGPGLHGLRPAARAYFRREPKDLTPAQMAFLVSLIPGPIKYQAAFARGSLMPGFRLLVDDLLAKVRSVDALSEEQYQAARAEELQIRSPSAGAVEAGDEDDAS